MIVELDNGHGLETLGKRSPDGMLIEAVYTREIVAEVFARLNSEGYKAKIVTPETQDIPLKERVRRINAVCDEFGTSNVVSVSVHVNAAKSDGKWHNARGWCSFVGTKTSSNSKRLARILWERAIGNGLKGNRWIPNEMYLQKNLSMCNNPKCPAVLVEVSFMDNKEDMEMMLSENGRERIINTIVQGIKDYIDGK